jgi:hypothetical protein
LGQNNAAVNKSGPWYLMASLSMTLGTVVLIFLFLSLTTAQTFTPYGVLSLGVGFGLQVIGIALILFGKAKKANQAS